jgi:hypothetical protein
MINTALMRFVEAEIVDFGKLLLVGLMFEEQPVMRGW